VLDPFLQVRASTLNGEGGSWLLSVVCDSTISWQLRSASSRSPSIARPDQAPGFAAMKLVDLLGGWRTGRRRSVPSFSPVFHRRPTTTSRPLRMAARPRSPRNEANPLIDCSAELAGAAGLPEGGPEERAGAGSALESGGRAGSATGWRGVPFLYRAVEMARTICLRGTGCPDPSPGPSGWGDRCQRPTVACRPAPSQVIPPGVSLFRR